MRHDGPADDPPAREVGARHGFAEWWAQRRVTAVKSPRGFAQAVWAAAVSTLLARLVVTTDESGQAVAVALTDEDGQYTRVLWQRAE